MKIAFLTSCLEPGTDGVGDYTRALAGETSRNGHEVCQLALNDRHAGGEGRSPAPPTLRLGPALSWPERIARASEFLLDFDPDWVSVQFVCYGFHPKGFPFRLGQWLESLTHERQVQVMMHELWIGSEVGARVKDRWVGQLQKYCIRNLLRRLRPRVVHSSNPAYVGLLRQHGWPAAPLALFGAIPVGRKAGADWLFERLKKAGIPCSPETRRDFWIFGLFGTFHPVWPPEPLLSYLQEAGRRHGRRITLAAIGRLGPGQELWQSLARRYAGQVDFLQLGEQTPETISQFFHEIDFGIATTPRALIGKSATATAMLEHGLPVIVNREEVQFQAATGSEEMDGSLLLRADDELPARLARSGRRPGRSRLPEVTRQFLDELERQANPQRGMAWPSPQVAVNE